MFNTTTKKRIQALGILFLIIGTFTTVFNVYQLNFTSNDTIGNEEINKKDNIFDNEFFELKTADYSSNYSNTGGNLGITLHQSLVNITEMEFSNIDNYGTLIEACPASDSNFNSSFIEIDVDHIIAPNKTLDIESSDSNNIIDLSTTIAGATHFVSRGNGYIENVSVRLTNVDLTNNATCQLVLYAYDSGNNRPAGTDQYDEYAILRTFQIPNNTVSQWYNITGIHQKINNSDTDDNKWFIGLLE